MQKFWELIEESVVFQGILLLLVFGTICYLVVTIQEVPKEMWGFAGVIVGFFFGGKAMVAQRKAVESALSQNRTGAIRRVNDDHSTRS